CPADAVTREQMSVFLLRTLEGSSYLPPACVTPIFSDVPCSSPYAAWVNEIAGRGITAGCGGGAFCPTDPVSRSQMAVFLTATFGLTIYAP
ncbi:MAG TPA: S-layer homology domain-containing protein, partial [Thermoanaerobaculia bacterium]